MQNKLFLILMTGIVFHCDITYSSSSEKNINDFQLLYSLIEHSREIAQGRYQGDPYYCISLIKQELHNFACYNWTHGTLSILDTFAQELSFCNRYTTIAQLLDVIEGIHFAVDQLQDETQAKENQIQHLPTVLKRIVNLQSLRLTFKERESIETSQVGLQNRLNLLRSTPN